MSRKRAIKRKRNMPVDDALIVGSAVGVLAGIGTAIGMTRYMCRRPDISATKSIVLTGVSSVGVVVIAGLGMALLATEY